MAQIIGLPKLSPTMEEGVLVKWVKKEGDQVEPGDLVAEVETDKANMDFNLEDEGFLLKLLVQEGDTVKLGAPVAIIGDKGEDISDLEQEAAAQMNGGAAGASAANASEDDADEADADDEDDAAADDEDDDETEDDRPAKKAKGSSKKSKAKAKKSKDKAAKDKKSKDKASKDKKSKDKGQKARSKKKSDDAPARSGGRLLASPLAKTLALELGIDLRSIEGTGPGGRIVERDVQAAASGETSDADQFDDGDERDDDATDQASAGAQAGSSSTALAVVPPKPLAVPTPDGDYEDTPLSGMRKAIAKRLTLSKQTIPHFYLTTSFDAGKLLAFRKALNKLVPDNKISVNDLLIKGTALALRRVPACNAAFLGDAIRYFSRVHIGVAVAVDDGLVTPVIFDADIKGIGGISREVKDLAARAREKRLKGPEIQGSTFSISNLGMYGIEHFEAVINPPEGGILAIGTIKKVPAVIDDRIAVRSEMKLTMSCDHRVIDGALGAQFLQELVKILEQPELLSL